MHDAPGNSPSVRSLAIVFDEDHAEYRERLARELENEGVLVESICEGDVSPMSADERATEACAGERRARAPEVLRALRRAGVTAPVILLTGFGPSDDHVELEALGGAAVLDKPFDFDDLRNALGKLSSFSRAVPASRGAHSP